MITAVVGMTLGAASFVGVQATTPTPTALSCLVMDLDSGRILYGKNINSRRYPASTTKIMTGLLLAENTQPSDILRAPSDIEKVTGSSLHMKPGEEITAEDMLYGLMLRSANDGAHTTALHVSGSVTAFARKMNERAKEAGAKNTTFYTPHGLPHDKHMTTAYDMAMITRDALKNPRFAEAVSTFQRTITRSINQEDTLLETTNKTMEFDASSKGVKTGWTNAAGRCFVGMNDRNGLRLLTVILKSKDWVADQQNIIEWGFKTFETRSIVPTGIALGTIPVKEGELAEVEFATQNGLAALASEYDIAKAKVFPVTKELTAPIEEGQDLGIAKVIFPDGTTHEIKIQAKEAVPRKAIFLSSFGTPAGMMVLMMGLGSIAYKIRQRRIR
ncbi:MAG: D-alanyl-D-alanine carboxypeptidase [Armatimonadetes bacterium]|nr:D-alanyl-D-alanine carboxypeptidase [Armatimonadota bacterium]